MASQSPSISTIRSEFESEVFELTAQTGQRRFFVHSDVLASQSEPLRTVIAGDWKESTERKIDLLEWDGDTVARLVSFLYTGDYQYPDPTPIPPGEQTTLSERPRKNVVARYGRRGGGSESGLERPLTPLSLCLQFDNGENEKSYTARLEPFDPNEYSFKEILLTHARIYALAQYKDVNALRRLALKRILQTLLRIDPIQPDSQTVTDVIYLLSYAYSCTDNLESSEEPLRRIVSQFAALNFPALQTRSQMADLVGQGGDFPKDLMAKVCRRLIIAEEGLRDPSDVKFVSNILVKHADNTSEMPPGCVKELTGLDRDINGGFASSKWAWLIPEYTSDPQDACTSFEIVKEYRQNAVKINLSGDQPVGEMFCYLIQTKNQEVKKKVTDVFLLRNPGIGDVAGVDGTTIDINARRRKDTLYLGWKSMDMSQ